MISHINDTYILYTFIYLILKFLLSTIFSLENVLKRQIINHILLHLQPKSIQYLITLTFKSKTPMNFSLIPLNHKHNTHNKVHKEHNQQHNNHLMHNLKTCHSTSMKIIILIITKMNSNYQILQLILEVQISQSIQMP